MLLKAFLLGVFLLTPGCASTIHELSNDSAIVGVTGFWASVGSSVSPSSAMPIPSVSIGYGTIWRIGKHDNINVLVNSSGGAGANAQLEIRASNLPTVPTDAPKATIP